MTRIDRARFDRVNGVRHVNLPNSITLSRIVMIPLLLWILSPHFPWAAQGEQALRAVLDLE